MKGCGRQNGMKLSLLTSHASVYNTTLVEFESGDTVERRRMLNSCCPMHPPHWSFSTGYYGNSGRHWNSCVMHRHTGPLGIMAWGGIGFSSLVRIAGTLNSQLYISEVFEPVVLPYLLGLATAIFQQDNARPHVASIAQRFFVNHQITLNCVPGRLALRIFHR
ncbi:transposable element Tcb1 transposase [Trichonephila clavipes]|nr:transposable element Tcb1 transposase [Trichonephila clavipes]